MKTKYVHLLITVVLSILAYSAHTQGCSDAGFCTINSLKPKSSDGTLENKNQIKAGVSFGSAEESISIFGNYIEYNRQLSNSFGIDVKIASLSQSGNGISTFGISDAYLTGNYQVNEQITLVLGTKIPLADGNKKLDNIALPMDYQSSLGTIDLILGLGLSVNKLQLALGYQQPLNQNKNEFLAEDYPLNSKIREFQSTNKFKRSGDALIRISYPIALSGKLKLTPSLLPIYHLSKDKYTNMLGIESEIDGSEGLTFNGNVYLDYEINTMNALQFNLGVPFVIRDVRPDGLTRSFVANLEYRIKF